MLKFNSPDSILRDDTEIRTSISESKQSIKKPKKSLRNKEKSAAILTRICGKLISSK